MSFHDHYLASLQRHQAVFTSLEQHAEQLTALFELCHNAVQSGRKLIFCGNGGSAADSQHLAAEFMVRYKRSRAPIRAIALTTDSSILTAQSNDYSFDQVFERQVQGLVDPGDIVFGLTTSGDSANVNRALLAANDIGAYSIAFTGRSGGQVKNIANYCITINSDETARIQEAHLFIGHWLCEAFDYALTT
ncbi:MAG TPA: SIS domain-containing protein [Marinagarivorans sp.]